MLFELSSSIVSDGIAFPDTVNGGRQLYSKALCPLAESDANIANDIQEKIM